MTNAANAEAQLSRYGLENGGENTSDPKNKYPPGQLGNFGIPEREPTPQPDYVGHDEPITEEDIPVSAPKRRDD